MLLPQYLEGFISEDSSVRVIDLFVDQRDLRALRLDGMAPALTRRPAYHPAVLLKIVSVRTKPS
jgi:transposase